jgi:hypothetical protein
MRPVVYSKIQVVKQCLSVWPQLYLSDPRGILAIASRRVLAKLGVERLLVECIAESRCAIKIRGRLWKYFVPY